VRSTIAGALALSLLASTSALAQGYSGRVVTFGDSLADIGNTFRLSGTPPSPPYFGGRFSNGPVFGEYLTTYTSNFFTPLPSNAGSVNYAFGGARTDVAGPLNGLRVAPGSALPGVTAPIVNLPPGVPVQIQSYLNRGGRFGPGDLVTVWGGANNFFDLFSTTVGGSNDPTRPGFVTPNTASITATGVSAAADIGRSVATLAQAGARNFVVLNLPDLGTTPQFNGSATTAAAGTGATFVFNTALSQTLTTVAAAIPTANIISVDINAAFQAVLATPAAFGFSNVTQACLSVASCATAPQAAQNQFLFWDGVHPTTAGHQLVANVVNQHLNAPAAVTELATLGELALEDRRGNALRALDRLESTRSPNPLTPWNGSLGVVGGSIRSDADARRPGYKWDNVGLGFGLTRGVGQGWTVGLSGALVTGDAKVGRYDLDATSANLDAAAGYSAGLFYAKAGAGLGIVDFSGIERRTVGPLLNRGDVNAVTGSAALEAGLSFGFGPVTLSPRARLAWFGASMDRLTENGIVAPVTVDGRTLSVLSGAAELKAGIDLLRDGVRTVNAYALVGYETYFSASGTDVLGQLARNTAQPFVARLGDPRDPGLTLGGGVTASLTPNLVLSAEYRGAFNGGDQRHQGMLSASYRF
jgi:outer membrane lipase/esterase